MGNCFQTALKGVRGNGSVPPIHTTFKFPAPLPSWSSSGTGFGSGVIDLGGLQVRQVSTLTEVWATDEGGPDNFGATFFEPAVLPEGFFMLGCYCQPNNKPLNGWVLVGKENDEEGALAKPIDYTLVWSTDSLKTKQGPDGAYIWLPVPPKGYNPVGLVLTTSDTKPPMGKIRCVRSDFTDQCEVDTWIWGTGKEGANHGLSVYGLRPETRGTHALGVCVGTFIAQNGGHKKGSPLPVCCLKSKKSGFVSSMPDMTQINLLIETYAPMIYFHPDEKYLPSSVTWYFTNKTMLHRKGGKSKPVLIEPDGSNLPQCAMPDQDEYWINLPSEKEAKERVKKGNLESTEAYFHIKPMYGATFTDVAIWVFYPFNGPSMAKFAGMNVPLGRIGEHVGDWEHVTLRVSNFNGELWSVYFSQHDVGTWVNASELEFVSENNGNNFAVYSSLKSHASYPKPGLFLQGSEGTVVGLRDDAAKGGPVLDTGTRFRVVAAEHLCGSVDSPPWVDYMQQWGPTVSYKMEQEEIEIIMKLLPWPLRAALKILLKLLPYQVFGEKGPLGPKAKCNWTEDEA